MKTKFFFNKLRISTAINPLLSLTVVLGSSIFGTQGNSDTWLHDIKQYSRSFEVISSNPSDANMIDFVRQCGVFNSCAPYSNIGYEMRRDLGDRRIVNYTWPAYKKLDFAGISIQPEQRLTYTKIKVNGKFEYFDVAISAGILEDETHIIFRNTMLDENVRSMDLEWALHWHLNLQQPILKFTRIQNPMDKLELEVPQLNGSQNFSDFSYSFFSFSYFIKDVEQVFPKLDEKKKQIIKSVEASVEQKVKTNMMNFSTQARDMLVQHFTYDLAPLPWEKPKFPEVLPERWSPRMNIAITMDIFDKFNDTSGEVAAFYLLNKNVQHPRIYPLIKSMVMNPEQFSLKYPFALEGHRENALIPCLAIYQSPQLEQSVRDHLNDLAFTERTQKSCPSDLRISTIGFTVADLAHILRFVTENKINWRMLNEDIRPHIKKALEKSTSPVARAIEQKLTSN